MVLFGSEDHARIPRHRNRGISPTKRDPTPTPSASRSNSRPPVLPTIRPLSTFSEIITPAECNICTPLKEPVLNLKLCPEHTHIARGRMPNTSAETTSPTPAVPLVRHTLVETVAPSAASNVTLRRNPAVSRRHLQVPVETSFKENVDKPMFLTEEQKKLTAETKAVFTRTIGSLRRMASTGNEVMKDTGRKTRGAIRGLFVAEKSEVKVEEGKGPGEVEAGLVRRSPGLGSFRASGDEGRTGGNGGEQGGFSGSTVRIVGGRDPPRRG